MLYSLIWLKFKGVGVPELATGFEDLSTKITGNSGCVGAEDFRSFASS